MKNEAKDPREYGYEGEMAMSQLKGILMHAIQLHDMLEPDTDLPEWVQSKITLAYDYIQTAADYMSTEMNEADVSKFNIPMSRPKAKKAPTRTFGSVLDEVDVPPKHLERARSVWNRTKDVNAVKKFVSSMKEEAPTNSVGDGSNIKGMRPDSIGVRPKAMKRYKDKNAAEAPKAGRKTFSMFMTGTK